MCAVGRGDIDTDAQGKGSGAAAQDSRNQWRWANCCIPVEFVFILYFTLRK